MTNEEAIKNLAIVKNLEDALGNFDGGVKNSDLSKSLAMAIKALGHQPCDDCISRQQAIDAPDVLCQEHRYRIPGKRETYSQYNEAWQDALDRAEGAIGNLPSAQPEIIYCRDCKYFELDHFEKVDEFPIPIIVAHEICMKWSGGCRTSIDGWCFMAERRADETD